MKPADTGAGPSEEQVVAYLKNHPGFFLGHETLLADLELSHPSGSAVSLVERQVSVLRDRNMEMRQRLAGLLDNAKRNDRLFEQTRKLILALLECETVQQFGETFRRCLHQDFQIEFAELTAFVETTDTRAGGARLATLADARSRIPSLLKSSRAVCGVLRDEELQFLFGAEQARAIGSAAVVPLQSGKPLGMIAIASRDPQHFRSSMGTLFLGYIGEVLDRLLPAHFDRR